MGAQAENAFIQEKDGTWQPTREGERYLTEAVTTTTGNVYSFYAVMSPVIIAAAMARLSRFGGDMRELILREFAGAEGKEEALLRRVLTQFGDDSVQQLGTIPIVVENASNLLTKQLEWGRLAAYLEQSTRYIYFDQKKDGKYRYYTPALPDPLQHTYIRALDHIFENYSTAVHRLTEWYGTQDPTPEAERDTAWRIALRGKACDAARSLLPTATTSTVGIVGSGQAIDNLIMHLQSQDLPEAQEVGSQVLTEVRKQHGIFFERTDLPKRGQATVAYRRQTRQRVAALARTLQTAKPMAQPASVTLLEYTPKDELELLTHMLYAQSNMDFATLQKSVRKMPKAQKLAAFGLYIGERLNRRHKPGRALEIAHYTFELVCDYGAFRDLQRHRMVDALEWQPLTPHLGYEIPEAATQAGLRTLFEETYAQSHELYEALLAEGYEQEAQYAVLLGHNMRWKVTLNARAAFHFIELRTQPAGHSGYRKLAKAMHDKIAEVHPLLAQAMIFVNREDDNPATSRLAQNRAAQKKLEKFGLQGLIE